MQNYNVVWNTPSSRSADSMPLGGYDLGCNVWVENQSLYFYVSESGTFDENGTMLKLARVRIQIENGENVFAERFRQELHLEEGYITVDAGNCEEAVRFNIWAAVSKPEVHVEFYSKRPRKIQVSLENWRYREREITMEELHQCRDFAMGYQGKRYTLPDTVETLDQEIYFYHQNKSGDTAWDAIIKQQNLEKIKTQIPNPLKHRIMGGKLMLPGMVYQGQETGNYSGTDYCGYSYRKSDATEQTVTLTLHTVCIKHLSDWKKTLDEKSEILVKWEDSRAFWKKYFERSYIKLDIDHPDSEAFRIGKNYQLFRYMLGCNTFGEYPTKFNGGLFTFDEDKTPDFRMWSGDGFTSQNQRLVYWGMLKSGDFDGMKVQLDYFKKLTSAAKARTALFFGLKGIFFYEQGNIFGTCTGAEYGWNRSSEIKEGLEDNPWVRLHFSSGLEFALMMFEYARYTGQSWDEYRDYIENIVDFYMNYYDYEEGKKLNIFPSSSLETYKGEDPHSKDDRIYGCKNPTDAITGLRCILELLQKYARNEEERERYEEYLSMCPEIPIAIDENGKKYYLPAEQYAPEPFNCELSELYQIFPNSPMGLTEEEREMGRNTYFRPYLSEEMYLGCSWHQNGIFAARLGLWKEAWKYLREKLDDGPKRFPAFWGPGHDWTPDHNHGGSGMIELQEMLLQCEGEKIILFPCWDRSMDASFRLCAPNQTVVECVLKNGNIQRLKVTPETRRKDVVIYWDTKEK